MLVAAVQRCGNGEAHQGEHDAGPCIAHNKHETFDKGGNDERQCCHTARLAGLHLTIGRAPGAIGIGNAEPAHDADGERVHGNMHEPRHFQVEHHKGGDRQANAACHGSRGEHAPRALVALVEKDQGDHEQRKACVERRKPDEARVVAQLSTHGVNPDED